MSLALPIPAAAAEIGVSAKTLRREIADGRIPIVRARSRVLVLRSDLTAYLAAHRRCQSAATVAPGKPAFNPPGRGLAELLRLARTRSNGKGTPDGGSRIIALAERRPTHSKKRSSAG